MAASQSVSININRPGSPLYFARAVREMSPDPLAVSFGVFMAETNITVRAPAPAVAQAPSIQEREARAEFTLGGPTPAEARATSLQEKEARARLVRAEKARVPAASSKRKATESPKTDDRKRGCVLARTGHVAHRGEHAVGEQLAQFKPRTPVTGASSSGARLGRRARRSRSKAMSGQGPRVEAAEASPLSQDPFYPLTTEEGRSLGREGKAPLPQSGNGRKFVRSTSPGGSTVKTSTGHLGHRAVDQNKDHAVDSVRSRLGSRAEHGPPGKQTEKGKAATKWVAKAHVYQTRKEKALLRREMAFKETSVGSRSRPRWTSRPSAPRDYKGRKVEPLSVEMSDAAFDAWIDAGGDGSRTRSSPGQQNSNHAAQFSL